MRSLTYGELIRGNRNFRNLLIGQFVSELGNWFNFIAGLGLVRLVSDASPLAAGLFFLARLLPFAVALPIAGTFVDRFSRRTVMLVTDISRSFIALSFLLVTSESDLWIAYLATVLLHTTGAFFDGAKNAAAPNLTGKEGLLAGTALLFSTRFLLMAVGSALGGWASAIFGYKVAFIINAVSFLASAFTVWLIPEESVREQDNHLERHERPSFFTELKEGLVYSVRDHFAGTILLMNVIWALGGGAINIIFERVGGVYFVEKEDWNPDIAVAVLWTATGIGLTAGMLIAHRTATFLDRHRKNKAFISWALIIHGVLFSAAAFMPTLWLFSIFVLASRAVVGVEYAVQETMFQRSLPDKIRGRISTLDRGAEMTVFGLTSYFTSGLMLYMSPHTLTVISGIVAGLAGMVWHIREGSHDEP